MNYRKCEEKIMDELRNCFEFSEGEIVTVIYLVAHILESDTGTSFPRGPSVWKEKHVLRGSRRWGEDLGQKLLHSVDFRQSPIDDHLPLF